MIFGLDNLYSGRISSKYKFIEIDICELNLKSKVNFLKYLEKEFPVEYYNGIINNRNLLQKTKKLLIRIGFPRSLMSTASNLFQYTGYEKEKAYQTNPYGIGFFDQESE